MRTLKHLLKTIIKYRLSSALTILSLVVAFLGIIILSLYVSYERSFDNFHTKGDNTYLFSFNFDMGAALSVPMAKLIKDKVPEIEKSVVYVNYWQGSTLYKPNQSKKEGVSANIGHVSADFFKVFDFKLLHGDATQALVQPNNIVISESYANKVFGSADVVGNAVVLGDNTFTVSAVMQDMPTNTSFGKDAFVPLDVSAMDDWSEWSFTVFYQLNEGANPQQVIDKIGQLDQIKKMQDFITEAYSDNAAQILLLPLSEIHYKSNTYLFSSINKKVLNILVLLTVILIIMGAVNFINFSTSQAPLRAKALSVQQILGESKWKARLQIVGEAVILSLLAMGIAFVLQHLLYTSIQNIFGIQGLSLPKRPVFYLLFVGFAIAFGALAGWYPSRYITSAPVSQAVKGKMFFSGKGKRFRHVLITTQFVFTIVLIASAFTIEKQLNFWKHFDIGIDKENVMYLETSAAVQKSYQAVAQELMSNAEITNYTYAQFLPGNVGMGWGRKVDGQQVQVKAWPVDDRFFDFFDIEIEDGRPFMAGEGDVDNFIMNQKAVQQFGWDKPLEKKFPGFNFEGDIVGVAKDFNFSSLKSEIIPLVFWRTDTRKNILMLKTKSTNYAQLRRFIETTVNKFDAEGSFEVKFLEDRLERMYWKEQRMAHFIEFVAVWTILLALTGLLGVVVFIARDKTKEIGIRKVNGATEMEIVQLLNKNVLIWLSVAFVIATPVAYYAMNKWLESFAYKTVLSWWVFALAGLSALLIALITVSWLSWRAASRNPVEALRYE